MICILVQKIRANLEKLLLIELIEAQDHLGGRWRRH